MNTSTPTSAPNAGTTPAGAPTTADRSGTPLLDRIEAFLLLSPVLEFIDRRCKRLVYALGYGLLVPLVAWHFVGPHHGYLPFRWLRILAHLVDLFVLPPCLAWGVVWLGRQWGYKVLWRIRQRHVKAAAKAL